MKVKTETVLRLNAWHLAAIEEALRNGLPHVDADSLARLIRALAKADGGKLTRRIAVADKPPAGVTVVPLEDPAVLHNTLKTILGED